MEEDVVTSLASRLAKHRYVARYIFEVIGAPLKSGVDTTTFDSISSALREYLGENEATFIVNSVLADNREQILDNFGGNKREKFEGFVEFLMYLRASYRNDLARAYASAIGRSDPDDWKDLNRSVIFNQDTNEWFIQVGIRKVSGEFVTLKMPVLSGANLILFIAEGLARIPRANDILGKNEDTKSLIPLLGELAEEKDDIPSVGEPLGLAPLVNP